MGLGSKPPVLTSRDVWRERVIQGVLAVVVWWAVYLRVSGIYGLGGGIIAATCAAWGYVLLSTYAGHLLNQRGSGPNPPRGPQTPTGRWPGARP